MTAPTRPYIYVTRPLLGTALQRLGQQAEIKVWPEDGPPSRSELLDRVRMADGLLCVLSERIDAELLGAAPRLRIVANMAVGYDNVDLPAASARGVLVTNTPGVLTETTADLAFALMLGFARRLVEGDAVVRQGRWPAWSPSFLLGRDLHGTTLGIVGLGGIGEAVARRARAFNMRVLYTSRTRKPHVEATLGIEWASLDEVLREADWLSLHVALSGETRGLIGARELSLMKPGAVLVNTARGAVVDEAALIEALASGRLAGAALDVFSQEPLPVDSPLLSLPNVLVSPHVGSATLATRTRMADLAVDNLITYFRYGHALTPLNAGPLAPGGA